MTKKGLTISIICEGESANYGEGYGNISTVKRINRADGYSYSYISRQALIYSLKENLDWIKTNTEVQGKVAQYSWDSNIEEYKEIDLFGYMKTKPKGVKSKNQENNKDESKNEKGQTKIRAAAARFSNAISLEAYTGDMDFGTNLSLANRVKGEEKGLLPYNSEIHKSYYTYTVTVDLDKIGEDYNDGINLESDKKKERVIELLKGIEFLHRDIKGRVENLNPIFAIGGVYDIKNPFFENRLELEEYKTLKISTIKNVLKSIDRLNNQYGNGEKENNKTYIGCILGKFTNGDKIKEELATIEISDFFEKISNEVEKYYEGNKN
ncbi:type I-B CRISPR-associated protein Cas7/Cst2/DevR [Brachyspira murdochii]|uniref:type I-B CRISPR-associated protein Cas7/Cst2/DevR n=1 Tax=Brachyspira murdochii TaxID=84378 RepID=UPI0030064222